MNFFYSLGIRFYSFAVVIASFFNSKAKNRVKGYRSTFDYLKSTPKTKKRVWFHCASLGEFEQGRPLIEKLQESSDVDIFVSFFSPSGYEIIKKKNLVENIFYLPPDYKSNAQKLVNLIQPDMVVFVKYEFWANLIFRIKKEQIPLYCISGSFRDDQIYFKKNKGFFQDVLKSFETLFVQNDRSKELAQSIGCKSVEVTGDTRFDRVNKGAKLAQKVELVEDFLADQKAFLVGSSWPDDEVHLYELFKSDLIDSKVIIAPHQVDSKHVLEIKNKIGSKAVLYSELKDNSETDLQFLIIDNIGMLSNLYQYGFAAYVGGAFHGSLHNILEPAAFGLPVIFGPKFSKFPEGSQFINEGIGFSISNSDELKSAYNKVKSENETLKGKVLSFVNQNLGSTDKIFESIKGKL